MLAETDRDSLNFTKSGNGKLTLVFLHYFGGSCNSWSGVIKVLQDHFTCIAIDLRGFGNSPAPEKQLLVRDNAKDVLDLIQTFMLKKFILVGHSMGGKIAFFIASQKPTGLASLILVAPSPPTPEPGNYKTRKTLKDAFGDRTAIASLIIKITSKQLGDMAFEEAVTDHLQIAEIAWTGWIDKGSREDISSVLQDADMHVLVISGASDPNFSSAFLRKEFFRYFPLANFNEIPEAGHLLPVEVPCEIARSIREFISGNAIEV